MKKVFSILALLLVVAGCLVYSAQAKAPLHPKKSAASKGSIGKTILGGCNNLTVPYYVDAYGTLYGKSHPVLAYNYKPEVKYAGTIYFGLCSREHDGMFQSDMYIRNNGPYNIRCTIKLSVLDGAPDGSEIVTHPDGTTTNLDGTTSYKNVYTQINGEDRKTFDCSPNGSRIISEKTDANGHYINHYNPHPQQYNVGALVSLTKTSWSNHPQQTSILGRTLHGFANIDLLYLNTSLLNHANYNLDSLPIATQ